MTKAATKGLEKPYELTFSVRSAYLRACINAATITRAVALDYLADVSLEAARTRRKRILIERNVESMMTDQEQFATMRDFVGMSHGIRVAFVNPHVKIQKSMRKIIDFAIQRGVDFGYFDTTDEAEEWLNGD